MQHVSISLVENFEDGELSMYISEEDNLGQADSGEFLLEHSRQNVRDAYSKYKRQCSGVRVLRRLRPIGHSLYVDYLLYTKRIKEIPNLFRAKKQLMAQLKRGEISCQEFKKQIKNRLVESGFPRGYVLSTEERELAKAKCEYSRSWWEHWDTEKLRRNYDHMVKKIKDLKGTLDREKWWYQRWKCANWPQGVRQPEIVKIQNSKLN